MRRISLGATAGRFGVLRSPVFLVSLALLLANDLYLKAVYPGLFTGKLSDFSGLLVFSLFLFPLLPVAAAKVAAGVALFFTWWKSPYSSFAIHLVNDFGLISIGRVVDYSDLLALAVLPFGVRVYHDHLRRRADPGFWRSVSLVASASVTVVAVTGTSQLHVTRPADIRVEEGAPALSDDKVDVIVESLFNSRHDECRERVDNRRTCFIDRVWFSYYVSASGIKLEFEQALSEDSIENVNRVIDSIKMAFAEQTEGLTYVEPLIDPRALPR
jgi:hypothetical protein